MRRGMLGTVVVAMALFSGCATAPGPVGTGSPGGTLQEAREGAIPQGYAELLIAATLKTHNPGVYASGKDLHGTPQYRLLVQIGGEPVQLQGSLRQEKTEGSGPRDPEAGQGVRYQFQGRVRLKAGTHRIVAALPADGVSVEREITVAEGTSNSIVLEPAYRGAVERQRPGFYGVTSFTEGIRGINVVFNNKVVE